MNSNQLAVAGDILRNMSNQREALNRLIKQLGGADSLCWIGVLPAFDELIDEVSVAVAKCTDQDRV